MFKLEAEIHIDTDFCLFLVQKIFYYLTGSGVQGLAPEAPSWDHGLFLYTDPEEIPFWVRGFDPIAPGCLLLLVGELLSMPPGVGGYLPGSVFITDKSLRLGLTEHVNVGLWLPIAARSSPSLFCWAFKKCSVCRESWLRSPERILHDHIVKRHLATNIWCN